MDIYLMIRRQKTTLFVDTKENVTVSDFKKQLEPLYKPIEADCMRIFYGDNPLDDDKTLKSQGITSENAKPQEPLVLKMAWKVNDEWEDIKTNIIDYTTPPELPEVMKSADATSGATK